LIIKKKSWLALGAEVSSLYMGDSSFNHVPLLSPSVPRLARIQQNTFAIHCLAQTGDVVLQLALQGKGILMHV
jgi:hypothetical protein